MNSDSHAAAEEALRIDCQHSVNGESEPLCSMCRAHVLARAYLDAEARIRELESECYEARNEALRAMEFRGEIAALLGLGEAYEPNTGEEQIRGAIKKLLSGGRPC